MYSYGPKNELERTECARPFRNQHKSKEKGSMVSKHRVENPSSMRICTFICNNLGTLNPQPSTLKPQTLNDEFVAIHPIPSSMFAGHANCGKYKEPAPPDPDVPPPERYHWDRFPHQNGISKRIVDASGSIFVDVASITRNRPDSHVDQGKDCLHYCLPGPIDTWTQVLFNVFHRILQHV